MDESIFDDALSTHASCKPNGRDRHSVTLRPGTTGMLRTHTKMYGEGILCAHLVMTPN